jgi:hypothetical protein
MSRKFLSSVTLSSLSTGVVHADSSGNLTSSNITNADVASNAGISQSKLEVAAATQWVSGTTYAVGNLVYNLGVTYRRKVAGAGVTAPASDSTNWAAQTAPTSNYATGNSLVLRDNNGDLGAQTFTGNIGISNSSLSTNTFLDQATGNIYAAANVKAQSGDLIADDETGGYPTPIASGGNVRAVKQIMTASTASDSITTPGGVTAASATLTTGFSTAGVVHNNTSGNLSSSLIVDADISSSTVIASSKIGQPKSNFVPVSGTDSHPRFVASGARSLSSGQAYFAAFIPETTITISSLQVQNGAICNPASGTNKFQVGVFTVAAGGANPTSLTCVTYSRKERTTSTTTPAAFSTGTSGIVEGFNLGYNYIDGAAAATNGAPVSVTLTAGTTYWLGICGYASAGFTASASIVGVPVAAVQPSPFVGLQQTGQAATNFAVSTAITVATGLTAIPFFRMV